jgi:MFS family permease
MSANTPSDPYVAWRNRSYRFYAVSWFLMAFSKQVEMVAIRFLVYAWTADQLALGWLGLIQAAPVILLAIPGGQLADRVDRRGVVVATLAASALVSLGIAAAVHLSNPAHWIYLLLGAGAVSQALGGPSRSALLPQLVSPSVFSNAVAWNSSVFQIATISGPAIGGLILVVPHGATLAFATVATCRLLSLAAMLPVRCRPVENAEASISLESLMAGIHFVWNTKMILAPITLDLFAVLVGGLTYLLPVFAVDILHAGSWGMGLLQSAEAVGAVVMTVLITHLPPMRRPGHTMLWAVAGFGVATIIFGLSHWFWLSLLMMFCMGALDNISVVVRHTLVQILTPDAMRGRVSAVNNVFIVASNDLGGFESGLTARLFGPVASVVGGGIGTLLVVCGATRVWPGLLSLGSLQELRPAVAVRAGEEEAVEL